LLEYLVLWILPLVTVVQAILRLRAICEHGATSDFSSPLTAARTTTCPPWLAWLLGVIPVALLLAIWGAATGGPTILLDVSAGQPSSIWAWIASDLGRHYRVVAYDRPGMAWSIVRRITVRTATSSAAGPRIAASFS